MHAQALASGAGAGEQRPSRSEARTSRILVADDHALFRRGLELLLQRLFPEAAVFGVADANKALQAISEDGPFDVVILDLAMPGMSGVAGVRRFVEAQPAAPVIMLSAYAESDEILECIGLGVRGYVPKSSSEEVLEHALSLVLAGEVFIPSSAVNRLNAGTRRDLPAELQGLPEDNPLRQLSTRQRETLALMIEGHSNKEIARKLGLLESTVKAHIKVILKKLSAQNRTQAALIAADLGWPRPVKARV